MEPSKQPIQILVVDDEPAIREFVCLLMKHDGHEVETAACGEAALALLAQRHFDLVITDFSMPGMQGDELVARIRQQRPTQRVIMATAFAEEFKVFGQADGHVDALLLKPFTLQELRSTIESVLAVEPPGLSHDLPALEPPAPSQRKTKSPLKP